MESQTFKKILIVEDDPIQTVLLSEFFAGKYGAEVLTASDGSSALGILRKFEGEIDFITTDIEMPNMGGIELLRQLKWVNFDGPIAVISGISSDLLSQAKMLARLHELDLVGICTKPVSFETLDQLNLPSESNQNKTVILEEELLSPEEVMDGLLSNEFVPYYQPKVCIETKAIVGAEALARWIRPDIGLVPPFKFIPLIEQQGLTSMLTTTMLKITLRDMELLNQQGLNLKAAVNVTSNEIRELSFPDAVQNLLDETQVPGSQLTLEVTENLTLELTATSLEVLTRLRLMGVDVAIDDFGTGYSNIKTLKDFPYNELKIDQTFIRSALNDNFSVEAIKASIALGRQQKMRVMAEGVETKADWEFVKQLGIDEVQGYLVAKPMPFDEFREFCNANAGKANFAEVA